MIRGNLTTGGGPVDAGRRRGGPCGTEASGLVMRCGRWAFSLVLPKRQPPAVVYEPARDDPIPHQVMDAGGERRPRCESLAREHGLERAQTPAPHHLVSQDDERRAGREPGVAG
jgi:hypothetical protein